MEINILVTYGALVDGMKHGFMRHGHGPSWRPTSATRILKF